MFIRLSYFSETEYLYFPTLQELETGGALLENLKKAEKKVERQTSRVSTRHLSSSDHLLSSSPTTTTTSSASSSLTTTPRREVEGEKIFHPPQERRGEKEGEQRKNGTIRPTRRFSPLRGRRSRL